MKTHMFRMIGKHEKIFRSIIISYAINMMNHLGWIKKSTQIFFSNYSRLPNISLLSTKRMIWLPNIDIPSFVSSFSTFPSRIVTTFHSFRNKRSFSSCPGNKKTFSRTISSLIFSMKGYGIRFITSFTNRCYDFLHKGTIPQNNRVCNIKLTGAVIS